MNESERTNEIFEEMKKEQVAQEPANEEEQAAAATGNNTKTMVTESGHTVVVDATEHIESDRAKSVTHSRPQLKDWAKIVQLSGRFSEVSTEQLERVKLMHDRFSEGAEFSFNYNTLLFVASILAGFGLASNSASTIIASMLVSPIMVRSLREKVGSLH